VSDVTILVSPAEPKRLRRVGETSFAPEEFGADFLIVGEAGTVGVQRKAFPGDLLSSVGDGRLHTVVMRLKSLTFPVVVLEGQGQWTTDGVLLNAHGHREFKRSTLRAMEWSLMSAGIPVQWTDSIGDTIEFIEALAAWWGKETHSGFMARPGPGRADEFGTPTSEREWAQHLLQGFDGVGPELAGRIFDEFKRIPLRWDVTAAELGAVHGLGPKRLASLMGAVSSKEDGGEETTTR